jgi:hypothetical protein
MPRRRRRQIVKQLAGLYHDSGDDQRAVELLEGQIDRHSAKADLTHINMLADLYMGMVRARVLRCVRRWGVVRL